MDTILYTKTYNLSTVDTVLHTPTALAALDSSTSVQNYTVPLYFDNTSSFHMHSNSCETRYYRFIIDCN